MDKCKWQIYLYFQRKIKPKFNNETHLRLFIAQPEMNLNWKVYIYKKKLFTFLIFLPFLVYFKWSIGMTNTFLSTNIPCSLSIN